MKLSQISEARGDVFEGLDNVFVNGKQRFGAVCMNTDNDGASTSSLC